MEKKKRWEDVMEEEEENVLNGKRETLIKDKNEIRKWSRM